MRAYFSTFRGKLAVFPPILIENLYIPIFEKSKVGSFSEPVGETFSLGNFTTFPFGSEIEIIAVAFFAKWTTEIWEGLFNFT